MNGFRAVLRRELKGYFSTPVAYVFLVIFLLLATFFAFTGRYGEGLLRSNAASLHHLFRILPWLFILFAPALTMRSWAEERRTGTIEHLFSLPLTVPQAVLGKFFAAWLFLDLGLLLTLPLLVTICVLGDPDWGPILGGYLGASLLAAAYLAIGTFFSCLTKNQVIAFVLGALVCAGFAFAGSPAVLGALKFLPALGARFLESCCFISHFEALQRGLVELRSLFFLTALTASFLAAAAVYLEARKAR